MALLSVGTMAFDHIETPYAKSDRIVGGSGTFIAWAASFFTSVYQLSIVGEDFPQIELDMLAKRNVDIQGVEIRKGEKTFYWHGKYHIDMNNRDTIETQVNVLGSYKPVLPPHYKEIDFVLLGAFAPDIQLSILEQMKKRPRFVALDTFLLWIETARPSLDRAIGKTDILIINDMEAKLITKEHSLSKAAKKILQWGPSYLIIKKGEHGALLFYKDKVFSVPGLPLEEVFDPTGAGDAFGGGVMGYLSKMNEVTIEEIKTAIIYGSAIASFSVEKFGIERLRTLTLKEIYHRAGVFTELTQFTL